MNNLKIAMKNHKDNIGVIAQLVERVLSMHEALGSTPSNSIIFLYIYKLDIFNKLFIKLFYYNLFYQKNIIKEFS
jgi:hypothetical protein